MSPAFGRYHTWKRSGSPGDAYHCMRSPERGGSSAAWSPELCEKRLHVLLPLPSVRQHEAVELLRRFRQFEVRQLVQIDEGRHWRVDSKKCKNKSPKSEGRREMHKHGLGPKSCKRRQEAPTPKKCKNKGRDQKSSGRASSPKTVRGGETKNLKGRKESPTAKKERTRVRPKK